MNNKTFENGIVEVERSCLMGDKREQKKDKRDDQIFIKIKLDTLVEITID